MYRTMNLKGFLLILGIMLIVFLIFHSALRGTVNQKAEEEKRQQEIYAEAVALGKELESKKVTLQIKGGEGGKTFGSITAKEISQGLKDQTGIEIDKKKLVLADAIKTAGTFKVGVKLHPKVTVDLNVAVELI